VGEAGGVTDRIERLSIAERWLADAFEIWEIPAGLVQMHVDMSAATRAIQGWRARGVHATVTTLVVRAAALALARVPRAHQLLAGYRRLRPSSVDIGLSVGGTTNYAPVAVVRGADALGVPELTEALRRGAEEARVGEAKMLRDLSRFGWLLPFRWLRRLVLRAFFRSLAARRQLAGTFQITSLQSDVAVSLQFVSTSVLAMGRVAERVIAVAGQPVVRPTVTLSLSLDHRALDGVSALGLLEAIQRILEDGGELMPPGAAQPSSLS
jgi:pyruvate dehydrogenase E2 component (dihydrolipoamide acetyltransferase)